MSLLIQKVDKDRILSRLRYVQVTVPQLPLSFILEDFLSTLFYFFSTKERNKNIITHRWVNCLVESFKMYNFKNLLELMYKYKKIKA